MSQNQTSSKNLSIYIPWPFPPVWGVADNTKEPQKQWGFHSVLLVMTRDPAEFGWHCCQAKIAYNNSIRVFTDISYHSRIYEPGRGTSVRQIVAVSPICCNPMYVWFNFFMLQSDVCVVLFFMFLYSIFPFYVYSVFF